MEERKTADHYTDISLWDGLATFDTRSRRVHAFAYVFGVLLWFVVFAACARTLSGDAVSVATRAAVVAAFVVGVYYGALFVSATGSPVGNIVAPTLVTVGTPGFLYRALLPSDLLNISAVVPFSPGELLAVSALIVGLVTPLIIIGLAYVIRRSPAQWERNVMPAEFSLIELFNSQGEQIRSSPQSAFELHPKAGAIGVPLFFAFVIATVLVLTLVPDGFHVAPGDVTGPMVVAFVVVFLQLT